MKALLHCGTYKTGSTTIQNTAWQNQTALRQQGVLYPKTGIEAASKDVGCRHAHFVYQYGKQGYSTLLANLDKEIKAAGGHRLFMSTEAWSQPQAAVTLDALVKHLQSRDFKEVQGIVFLRNAREYMVRHYREWVRRYGATVDFQSYVMSRKHFFDYLTLCKKIKAIFKNQVDFVAYDTVDDVGRYTFEQLGIDPVTLQHPTQTNAGLSCLDIEIRRILNEYGLRVSNPPDAHTLLNRFGLQADAGAFSEALPKGFLEVYDASYIREFSAVTRLNRSACRSIFQTPDDPGVDIAQVSPILEKVIFEWLKDKRRQAS